MAGNFWRSSHCLEWLLDKQYVLKNRENDIKELGGEDEYQKLMIFFTGVTISFGEKLGLRQQVIATAVTYFKRFYSMYSLKSVDPWLMSQTALFLASKIEEFGLVSHKSIIQTCNGVIKQKYSQYFPREYPHKIQDVLDCEFILVEVLDCSLIVFHPYRSLILYTENLASTPNLQHDPTLLQRAWKIVNDSLRTDLMLYYPPYLISLGCLFLACVMDRKNEEATQTWFAELSVDFSKIMEVVKTMSGLYCLWKTCDDDKDIFSLLAKMPKPKVHNPNQQPQSQQQQQQQQHNTMPHQQIPGSGSLMKSNVIQHPGTRPK